MINLPPWLARTLGATRPRISWSRSARGAICIGLPFLIGTATGHVLDGMWVAMASMFFLVSEKPSQPYQRNIQRVFFVAPIAAAAFLLGYVRDVPFWAQLVFLAALATFAGAISTWNSFTASAAMQTLMICSLVIGMHAGPWWRYGLFYLLGAAFYAALLLWEGRVFEKESSSQRLAKPLLILATTCTTRALAMRRGAKDPIAATTAGDKKYVDFSRAFADAYVPDAPQTRSGQVLEDLDLVEASAWNSRDPAALEQVSALLRAGAGSLVGDRPAEDAPRGQMQSRNLREAVDALGKSIDLYLSGSDERRVEKLYPSARSLLSAPRRRWTGLVGVNGLRLGIAYTIALLVGYSLPFTHWFWTATTVALIMAPNMSAVVSRAVQRSAGTVVGVGLGTLFLVISANDYWISIVITILGFFLPWAVASSQVYKQFFMTPIILLLGDIVVPGDGAVFYGAERLAATLMGATIAIVFGYLLWSVARRPRLRLRYGKVQAALVGYFDAVLSAPAPALLTTFSQRDDVYRAIGDFHMALVPMLSEPPPTSTVAESWVSTLLATGRVCDQVTMLAQDAEYPRVEAAAVFDRVGQMPTTLDFPPISDDSIVASLVDAAIALNRRLNYSNTEEG